MRVDNFWVVSHSKAHLEQMLKDLIQEAAKWDLEPKPASLWCTSTYDGDKKMDLVFDIRAARHRVSFEEMFMILGFFMNRQIRTKDCCEEEDANCN